MSEKVMIEISNDELALVERLHDALLHDLRSELGEPINESYLLVAARAFSKRMQQALEDETAPTPKRLAATVPTQDLIEYAEHNAATPYERFVLGKLVEIAEVINDG